MGEESEEERVGVLVLVLVLEVLGFLETDREPDLEMDLEGVRVFVLEAEIERVRV
jgi:hypothetical protein